MKTHAPNSASKAVLTAMAYLLRDAAGKVFASAAKLVELTQLDRKTVLASIKRLEDASLIVRLDEVSGRGGAPVFVLQLGEAATGQTDTEIGTGSTLADHGESLPGPLATHPKNGTSSAPAFIAEPVPDFPRTSTVFPTNPSRFSHEPVPDLGHNQITSIEPMNQVARNRAPSFDASQFELPDWLPREAWSDWVADRKDRRKPITPRAAMAQIKALAEYRKAGHAPTAVISHSIASGYQGLFPPRTPSHQANHADASSVAPWKDAR